MQELRDSRLFDAGWKFLLGDPAGAEVAGYDVSAWRDVDLPHDWSIEGPYDENNPVEGGGGYLPGGVGWYRRGFALPAEADDKRVWIEFDGVYKNCDVYVNGEYLGFHPHGYTAFYYDLTPYVNWGAQNEIAVRVDDSTQPDTRWYSGAGIYRHVWLHLLSAVHVAHWGTFVRTPEVRAEEARLELETVVENDGDDEVQCTVLSQVVAADGQVVLEHTSALPIADGEACTFRQRVWLPAPHLWSVEDPYLYTLHTVVKTGDAVVDDYDTPFGVREISFDVEHGFELNGKQVKINGVCLHHDGGCVGGAVPERVWERRLQTLKEMGCNGIRSSHYPPAREFLDLCDRMGFLVMDEAFDEWAMGKVYYGYHEYFDDWAITDLVSMLHRDRNHPSIVLWSVGNEIPEQSYRQGPEILQMLVNVVHEEDPSRPVTSACDNLAAPVPTTDEFAGLLDVVGYNYADRWGELREITGYSVDRITFPERKMIGSENVSIPGIRGVYTQLPGEWWVRPYFTAMLHAEQLYRFTATHDYVAGDYMWTGIDYLGEARWPSKHSSSGVIDLCGFPKDSFYFYQSQWTKKPMVHLFPHWNWAGREGEVIRLICYTNCDTVELFVNGVSYGAKAYAFPHPGMSGREWHPEFDSTAYTTNDLHLSWDVLYQPGTIKAVGVKDGQVVCEQEIATTGAPAALRLTADRTSIAADGRDVAHLTVEALDAAGRPVPTADDRVTFEVAGAGKLIGVDNGDPRCYDDYKANDRALFSGLALAIVQSTGAAGEIEITATAPGLQPARVTVRTGA